MLIMMVFFRPIVSAIGPKNNNEEQMPDKNIGIENCTMSQFADKSSMLMLCNEDKYMSENIWVLHAIVSTVISNMVIQIQICI